MLYCRFIAIIAWTEQGKRGRLYHRGGAGSWLKIPQTLTEEIPVLANRPTCLTWPRAIHQLLLTFMRGEHIKFNQNYILHKNFILHFIFYNTLSISHKLIISSRWGNSQTHVWAISPQNWSLTFSKALPCLVTSPKSEYCPFLLHSHCLVMREKQYTWLYYLIKVCYKLMPYNIY